MADVGSIQEMVQSSIGIAGQIDVLVNNAGVTRRRNFLQTTEEDWDWVTSVNERGVFFCMQAVAREMIPRRKGKIVNMSSIGGKGSPGASSPAYAASKAAVIALTRYAARELGPSNINVNAVCPGATETGLYHAVMKEDPQLVQGLQGHSVLNRTNSTVDVANAVLFLSSPLANNITGQSLNVDNGSVWD
jgi:NAD(P)-dependent dehydrogenase (short-subunit alcohol dehydrogenase family)